MSTINLPQEAERIAELGYPVFPCRDPRDDPSPVGKRGKIPLVSGGVSSTTIDLDQVAKWWQQWPTANIGLACQKCLILDLDVKDGKQGSDDISMIAEELGPLDPTVVAATGSGGWHLFFSRPSEEIVGKTNVPWHGQPTGIDIRVGNQYVIAPPSLHESGKRYEWLRPLVPVDSLAPIPQEWIDGFLPKKEASIIYPKIKGPIISHDKVTERCLKYVSTMPEAVSGSGGHPTTLAVANAIFCGFGLDERNGWPILLQYNARCKPPWSEAELRHKMNDARNKPPPGKEFGWLLNANREQYQHSDFQYTSNNKSQAETLPTENRLIAPRLSSFDRENITFLWPDRIMNGKLVLYCGDGSAGKTWLLCYMSALVSRGGHWPDGTPCEQGGVIFFSSEDGAGDTLRPRIEDNGGDTDHIYIPQIVIQPDGNPKEFTLKEVVTLGQFIETLEKENGVGYVKLVIFDPITAFMGEIDEFKNNQVRAAFRPMARLADEKKFAWIGVGHPKKGAEQGKAKDAFSGSIAYTNAARLVWNFYHDRESGIRRMLLAKNNLLVDPKGLAYIVKDGIVSFTDTSIATDADEYLRQIQKPSGNGRGRPKMVNEQAVEWLFEYLKDGPKPSGNKNDPTPGTVFGDAKEQGFKCNTIWRAAEELGICKRQEQFSKRWMWSLPEIDVSSETDITKTSGFAEFNAFG